MMIVRGGDRTRCTCSHKSVWESRMFRPRGKKTEAHNCTGDCRHRDMKSDMPAEGCRAKHLGGR
jgi:hypothetical protein